MQLHQTLDDLFVVLRIRVIVGRSVAQLPVATQMLKRVIDFKKVVVVRLQRIKIESSDIFSEHLGVRCPTGGS